jgi:hypothetical protein
LTNPEERRAKRQYRRSLPPFYRWRRVIVTIAIVVVAALALTLTGNNPVGYLKDRWRDLTVEPVVIDGVAATAEGFVAPGYHVARLPGPRSEAWATRWPHDPGPPGDCGRSQAAGWVVLHLNHPTHVRKLYVWAGLGSDSRQSQFRPKRLDVRYSATGCKEFTLADTADRQELSLDTGTAVRSLAISVGDAYAPRSTPSHDLVAIGGIEVLYRPD